MQPLRLLAAAALCLGACADRAQPVHPRSAPASTRVGFDDQGSGGDGQEEPRGQFEVEDEEDDHAEQLGKVIDWLKALPAISEHVDDFRRCVVEGAAISGCAARLAQWGVCFLASDKLEELVSPEWGELGLPFEAVCNGDPALKCCRYDSGETGCHSAFNSDRPINCEGNPLGGQTFGVCVPRNAYPGDIGCFCDYLAECVLPGGSTEDSTGADAWREAALTTRLAAAVPQLLGAAEDAGTSQTFSDFADFVALTGCQAQQAFLLEAAPFAGPAPLPAGQMLPSYYTDPTDEPARWQRDLTTIAVRRILAGIPNGLARWNYADQQVFTPEQRAAYIAQAGEEPAAALGRLLGPFGLQLLQTALPGEWDLLAVPLSSEGPDANVWPYVAGCLPGQPPALALTASAAGAQVTLALDVDDPELPHNALRAQPVAIDWGDGVVSQHLRFPDSPQSQGVSHVYREAGPHAIRAWVLNSAGLIGAATASAQTAEGNPGAFTDRALSVASLQLELDGVVAAVDHGDVQVEVSALEPDESWQPLGDLFSLPPDEAPPYSAETFPLREPLNHPSRAAVLGLRLVPDFADQYNPSQSQLRLGAVHLTREDGSVADWQPGLDDARVFLPDAGVPVAAQIDPATGALLFPSSAAEIDLYLPDRERPGWCRSLYDGGVPSMRSALGGCEDLDTGLVWSALAPPLDWSDAGVECGSLAQGGARDWRFPSDAELSSVAGPDKAGTYLPALGVAWSADVYSGGWAVTRDLASGDPGYSQESSAQSVICVRGPSDAGPGARLGDACDGGTACESGFCVDGVCCAEACGGGAAHGCLACSVDAGGSADGTCTLLHGAACSDGQRCAAAGACNFGVCEAAALVDCAAAGNECAAGATCLASTGACEELPLADGTGCDGGQCLGGTCVPAPDAGSDAGPGADAGAPDAGSAGDGGSPGPDAGDGGQDAGGGADDAGPGPDAGAGVDAGAPDAGPVDAGTADAGPIDAGAPDAGTPDAGTPDAGMAPGSGGMGAPGGGCTSTPPELAWLALVFLARGRRAARRGAARPS